MCFRTFGGWKKREKRKGKGKLGDKLHTRILMSLFMKCSDMTQKLKSYQFLLCSLHIRKVSREIDERLATGNACKSIHQSNQHKYHATDSIKGNC